jgi:hypothetical protein
VAGNKGMGADYYADNAGGRMKHICFDKRFVDFEKSDLKIGKIHTIRRNFNYWKKFEGKELALFTWEGKPYHSKQKVFCVKRLVSVQPIMKAHCIVDFWTVNIHGYSPDTGYKFENVKQIKNDILAKNDGLPYEDFIKWFYPYPFDIMAILHFTDFQY